MSKRAPKPDLDALMPLLIGVWRRFRKEGGPSDVLQTREFRGVVSGIKTLISGLGSQGNLLGKDYFADRELLGSYLLYQWVLHYQQGLSLINELPHSPRRVLDLCSGPAPLAFAALRHGAHEVTAIDQNAIALELGAEVCGRYGMPLTIRKWNCLKGTFPVDGMFDLIIIGHCLEELFPSNQTGWKERQQLFIKGVLNKLTPDGHLLIVENSYMEANRRVLELRDYLVNEGVPVQAPCVFRGECPALKAKDSPCYAQREFEKPFLIKEFQRAAEINLSSLKMTYIIFRSPKAKWPELPEKPLFRIISPPVDTYQGKRYYICGIEGKRTLGSQLKEHSSETRAFEYLKRGELISIQDGVEKQNAIDIAKGTQVRVEAACGKPIGHTQE